MTSLQKQNGPCQIIAQLHIALDICRSDNSKKELMKNEIRYLTNVLNGKDKRLVMGNKGGHDLKENWCLASHKYVQ